MLAADDHRRLVTVHAREVEPQVVARRGAEIDRRHGASIRAFAGPATAYERRPPQGETRRGRLLRTAEKLANGGSRLEMRCPGSKLANLVRLTADEAERIGANVAS